MYINLIIVGSGAPARWIKHIGTRTKPKHIRCLKFRPYVDSISIRPSKPVDRGYYYKLYKNSISLIRLTLEDNGFREATNQEWSIMWSVGNMKSEIYQSLSKYQKVNHFPRSVEITRKDCLCKNITKMQSLYGYRHFDFVPKTFVLPQELPLLVEEAENSSNKFWIVKPAASSQGRGIFVTNNISDIPNNTQLIASKYINDPLLVNGYKFDLRIYLAITSIDPLRLYVYEEGLARFATCKYSVPIAGNKGNRFMHLTNYSVNKHNVNFVPNEDPTADDVGNKWSLTALKKHFEAAGINSQTLWARIDEILIKTVLSIEPLIKSSCDMYVPYRNSCFELLGFDILIDSALNPWLIEVNLSPSLNCDAPIDQKIKGELIADLFTMIGIVPLDQREYSDIEILKKQSQISPYALILNKNKKKLGPIAKSKASNIEKTVIRETEKEYKRRGHFRRIFPTKDYAYYKTFFETERPLNQLLANHLMKQNKEQKTVLTRKPITRIKK